MKGEGSGSQRAKVYLNCDVQALHLRLAEAITHIKAENITCWLNAFMDTLEVVNAVLQNILKRKGCVCSHSRLTMRAKILTCKSEHQ